MIVAQYLKTRDSISWLYSKVKPSYIRSVYSQYYVDLFKCIEQNVNNQSLTQVSQLYVHISFCLKVIRSWLNLPTGATQWCCCAQMSDRRSCDIGLFNIKRNHSVSKHNNKFNEIIEHEIMSCDLHGWKNSDIKCGINKWRWTLGMQGFLHNSTESHSLPPPGGTLNDALEYIVLTLSIAQPLFISKYPHTTFSVN